MKIVFRKIAGRIVPIRVASDTLMPLRGIVKEAIPKIKPLEFVKIGGSLKPKKFVFNFLSSFGHEASLTGVVKNGFWLGTTKFVGKARLSPRQAKSIAFQLRHSFGLRNTVKNILGHLAKF